MLLAMEKQLLKICYLKAFFSRRWGETHFVLG